MSRKTKKNILIFRQCSELCQDLEWKERLLKFAQGKFEYHLTYDENNKCIKSKYKNSTVIPCLIPSDPEEALIIIKKYFRDNYNIRTRKELNKLIEDEKNSKKYKKWIVIKRSPKILNIILLEYVSYNKAIYNLDKNEVKKFRVTLFQLFNNKKITNDNILFVKNRIKNISNFGFDPIIREIYMINSNNIKIYYDDIFCFKENKNSFSIFGVNNPKPIVNTKNIIKHLERTKSNNNSSLLSTKNI